jgi:hypothetical protein
VKKSYSRVTSVQSFRGRRLQRTEPRAEQRTGQRTEPPTNRRTGQRTTQLSGLCIEQMVYGTDGALHEWHTERMVYGTGGAPIELFGHNGVADQVGVGPSGQEILDLPDTVA